MTIRPLADGWTTIPADGLYVVYIPRSVNTCEVRALEAGKDLRKGWRVWGPFSELDDTAEPLAALRLHFRSERDERRGRPALEPIPAVVNQSSEDLEPCTLPIESIDSQSLEQLLRRIVREELERILCD